MSEHSKAWKTRLKNLRESHDDAVRRLHREARRHSKAEAELKAERERVRQMEEALRDLLDTFKSHPELGFLVGQKAIVSHKKIEEFRALLNGRSREPEAEEGEEGEG